MELRDFLTLLFGCSKIHCYLLPIFVYPITARLDKFIHQNLQTPFHIHRDNCEHGTAERSLLLADHSEGKTSSYRPVVFNFWTLPRRRGTTHVGSNGNRFAEPRRDGTSGRGTSVSTRTTNLDATLPRRRTQGHRLHLHQPGRE